MAAARQVGGQLVGRSSTAVELNIDPGNREPSVGQTGRFPPTRDQPGPAADGTGVARRPPCLGLPVDARTEERRGVALLHRTQRRVVDQAGLQGVRVGAGE